MVRQSGSILDEKPSLGRYALCRKQQGNVVNLYGSSGYTLTARVFGRQFTFFY